MNAFQLHPLDTLFFRDARPMTAGAGSGGHGANWPLPNVLHESLRAALLRLAGESRDGKTRRGHAGKTIMSEAFRSLRTLGPLPAKDGTLYLPRPHDVVSSEDGPVLLRPLAARHGANNLPAAWLNPVTTEGRAGKGELPDWITVTQFSELLVGRVPKLPEKEDAALFKAEHRTGIGINPETGTVENGALFSSEHLRLASGVSLWFSASLSTRQAGENRGLDIGGLDGSTLTLGGESRMARVRGGAVPLKVSAPAASIRIKWVLASHAVFRGGWRPNWIDEQTGKVLLKCDAPARNPGEDRKSWRERIRGADNATPAIGARLVAACVSKPVHFSGWDLGDGGPKPTLAAAPAGSVFFFETDDAKSAKTLVTALHGRTRSDFFGEKGMGLGFCGTWEPADVAGRPITG